MAAKKKGRAASKRKKSKAKSPLAKIMARMESTWEDAKEEASQGGGFVDLPDGRYRAKLTEAHFHESQNGNTGILFRFEVTEGDHEGETAIRWFGLDEDTEPERLTWLLRFLSQLGVELDSLEPDDLEESLKDLEEEGLLVQIQLVTGNAGYQNLRINKVYGADAEEAEEDEEYEEEDVEEEDDDDEEESEDDEEEEDEDTEDIDLDKGMAVVVEVDGEEVEGEVVSVDEDAETAKVKVKGKRAKTYSWDDLEVLV